MNDFESSLILLLVILNPFALTVYLVELLRVCSTGVLALVLLRASLISGAVFSVFAVLGDRIFSDVLQIRFAAFQIFGGLLFVLIALRFMLTGGQALIELRGKPEHLAGSVAMPFMIGPGTVSAATLAGSRLASAKAVLCVAIALAVTILFVMLVKVVFDHVRERNARLLERYTEVASRVAAIVIGTVAIDMILRGIEAWLVLLGASA